VTSQIFARGKKQILDSSGFFEIDNQAGKNLEQLFYEATTHVKKIMRKINIFLILIDSNREQSMKIKHF
jgi:hypothetical protein